MSSGAGSWVQLRGGIYCCGGAGALLRWRGVLAAVLPENMENNEREKEEERFSVY